jgi:formylglycine-generating enzyme required for sulfatase activity
VFPLLAAYVKELCAIPGGTFMMGTNDYDDEKPVHEVTLSPFRIGKTPVTAQMWAEYCDATGRAMPTAPDWGWVVDHPIVNVRWEDCIAYCKWASKVSQVKMTLPTEAQWEYAAHGRTITKYLWGDIFDNSKLCCSVDTRRGHTVSVSRSHNVFVNGYGLLDMLGNVWEWCSNTYSDKYESRETIRVTSDETKVIRGGSWYDLNAEDFRCANRNAASPGKRRTDIGFRLSSSG